MTQHARYTKHHDQHQKKWVLVSSGISLCLFPLAFPCAFAATVASLMLLQALFPWQSGKPTLPGDRIRTDKMRRKFCFLSPTMNLDDLQIIQPCSNFWMTEIIILDLQPCPIPRKLVSKDWCCLESTLFRLQISLLSRCTLLYTFTCNLRDEQRAAVGNKIYPDTEK